MRCIIGLQLAVFQATTAHLCHSSLSFDCLIEPHKGLASRSEDDDVLNFAVAAKLLSNVLLLDGVGDAAAPHALGGHGPGEAQGDLAAAQGIAVTLANGATHTSQVGELHVGVARLLAGVDTGRGHHWAPLDVDFQDLSKALKLFLHSTGGHVAGEAPHEQSSRGFGVELFQFCVRGSVVKPLVLDDFLAG